MTDPNLDVQYPENSSASTNLSEGLLDVRSVASGIHQLFARRCKFHRRFDHLIPWYISRNSCGGSRFEPGNLVRHLNAFRVLPSGGQKRGTSARARDNMILEVKP